jgi:prefoldin subunit 5
MSEPQRSDEPDRQEDLAAEHQALKAQLAQLRREHNRLHAEGGTMDEHRAHREKLHEKVRELEAHLQRLRHPTKS